MQRTANPCMPVRFRPRPPKNKTPLWRFVFWKYMDVIEPARFAYESDFSSALRAEKAIRMVSQVATATVFAGICGKNANFPTQASKK